MAEEGSLGLVTCAMSLDPFGWLCTEIEMKIGGKGKKKKRKEMSERDLKLRPSVRNDAASLSQRSLSQ